MIFQTYQPIESAKVNITFVTFARIAEAFRLDVSELVIPAALKKSLETIVKKRWEVSTPVPGAKPASRVRRLKR